MLVSTYKGGEKKGKKGEKRKEKRQIELGILQLLEKEEAVREQREESEKEIEWNVKKIKRIMAEMDAPLSHVAPVQEPQPYEEEKNLYKCILSSPQLVRRVTISSSMGKIKLWKKVKRRRLYRCVQVQNVRRKRCMFVLRES